MHSLKKSSAFNSFRNLLLAFFLFFFSRNFYRHLYLQFTTCSTMTTCRPAAIKYFWRAVIFSYPLITQRILHPTGPLRRVSSPIPHPQIWASPPATTIDLVTTGAHRCSNVSAHRQKAFLSFRTKEIGSIGSRRGRITVYATSFVDVWSVTFTLTLRCCIEFLTHPLMWMNSLLPTVKWVLFSGGTSLITHPGGCSIFTILVIKAFCLHVQNINKTKPKTLIFFWLMSVLFDIIQKKV